MRHTTSLLTSDDELRKGAKLTFLILSADIETENVSHHHDGLETEQSEK